MFWDPVKQEQWEQQQQQQQESAHQQQAGGGGLRRGLLPLGLQQQQQTQLQLPPREDLPLLITCNGMVGDSGRARVGGVRDRRSPPVTQRDRTARSQWLCVGLRGRVDAALALRCFTHPPTHPCRWCPGTSAWQPSSSGCGSAAMTWCWSMGSGMSAPRCACPPSACPTEHEADGGCGGRGGVRPPLLMRHRAPFPTCY